MRVSHTLGATALAAIFSGACAVIAFQGSPSTPATVWDRVYTEAQAARGRKEYLTHCGYCHKDDLTGAGDRGEPPLVGAPFMGQWDNKPLADLFLAIGTLMPYDNPDSLFPQVVVDIVSFLLQANNVPAGEAAELPPDVRKLRQIVMTTRP